MRFFRVVFVTFHNTSLSKQEKHRDHDTAVDQAWRSQPLASSMPAVQCRAGQASLHCADLSRLSRCQMAHSVGAAACSAFHMERRSEDSLTGCAADDHCVHRVAQVSCTGVVVSQTDNFPLQQRLERCSLKLEGVKPSRHVLGQGHGSTL